MKTIYDKELKQINFLDERFYTMDGESFYPSVTSILDVYPKGYGFTQWLKDLGNNADEVVKRAAEKGSKIHDAIDKYLKGSELKWEDGYSEDEWMMLLRFNDFMTTYKPEILQSEISLCSPELGFGGTIDIVCKINGEVWLIDTKSGNAIHKSHEFQISAYRKMWDSIDKNKVQRMGILHLNALTRGVDKTGKSIQGEKWQLKEFTRFDESYKIFEYCHAIWKEENPNPKPKNLIYPSILKYEKTISTN